METFPDSAMPAPVFNAMLTESKSCSGAIMDIKRTATRGIAILAVALAAGHLVQTMAANKAADRALAKADLAPKEIVPLAAGAEATAKAATLQDVVAPKIDLAALPPLPARLPEPIFLPASVVPESPVQPEVADVCATSLDLLVEPPALIGLTLLAPCHINERVVLRHAGLAVTARTTATGALFTTLPALDKSGEIEVLFADGQSVAAAIEVPELAALHRFAIQWQDKDAFQLHAFENGASYGQPGHIYAEATDQPTAGVPLKGGFMSVLGDPTTDSPLLAQVFTFADDASTKTRLTIEAAVTDTTCDRELLGETLNSVGGRTEITDLTLAMPACDAIGDYLVLNNPAPDMNIAAAN